MRAVCSETMCGTTGKGCDMANHYLRETAALARRCNVSMGIAFFDLKDAFHAVIRSALTGDAESDETIRRICAATGATETEFRAHVDELQGANLAVTLDPHLAAITRDDLRHTWVCGRRVTSFT